MEDGHGAKAGRRTHTYGRMRFFGSGGATTIVAVVVWALNTLAGGASAFVVPASSSTRGERRAT